MKLFSAFQIKFTVLNRQKYTQTIENILPLISRVKEKQNKIQQNILRNYLQFNKKNYEIYINFIDLKNVYDDGSKNKLCVALRRKQIEEVMIEVYQDILVTLNRLKGFHQECCLSILIFNIFIEAMSILIGNYYLISLNFTDDQEILT